MTHKQGGDEVEGLLSAKFEEKLKENKLVLFIINYSSF